MDVAVFRKKPVLGIVRGIEADSKKCLLNANRSLAIVTALAPKIGYLKAAEVAKKSLASGRSIADIVSELNILSRASALKILDPVRLSGINKKR